MTQEIYLDANATSTVLPAAIDAAQHAMQERFGNPSSTHATGLQARELLDAVRARAKRVLGAGQGQVIFTSGATESIGAAVLSALVAVRERAARGEAIGKLLVYGATEHKAVPETLGHWNRLLGLNLELVPLPVDRHGRHRLEVLRALAPDAAMVCTMAANNETAVVSDLEGIKAVLRESGSRAFWMVDSVQALGKIDLHLEQLGVDYAPFSGHKLYAPKGIGMLYVREGAPFTSLTAGGGQELGMRAGTENMTGVAALGAVLAALEDGQTFRSHDELHGFREQLAAALREAFPGIVFNMPFELSLPTTLNFSVPGFSSQELLNLFDAAGVRVSSGSACSSAKAAPSYVLEAMDRPDWCASAAVRMSFGPLADAAFINAAVERIASCGAALRASCLIPSDLPPRSRDGVIQLHTEGQNCWIIADADSRSAVVIDALAPLAERIAGFLRCQDYQVRAVLDTGAFDGSGTQAVCALLGVAPGWPQDTQSVTLGDGSASSAIILGKQLLARLPATNGFEGESYLLGQGSLDGAHVSHAFTGAGILPGGSCCSQGAQRLAQLVHCDTVLCPSRDPANQLCSTPAAECATAESSAAPLLAAQPALVRPIAPLADMALQAADLERFLNTHPDALLIDVREVFEHAAMRAGASARQAQSVPLSQLAAHVAQWLHSEARPLVFFCRSGARSARAAQCLQRLGYAQAWYVAGPAEAVLQPFAMAA